jgi:CheY-like chemotaxis protein
MEPGGASRTIEEFFCPQCELFEVADSDQSTYVEMLMRWRKTDLPMPTEGFLAQKPDLEFLDYGILVVVEERDIRTIWSMVLKTAGYLNVWEAEDDAKAAEILMNYGSAIHAVVIDSAMPRMGGLVFVRHLVAEYPHPIGIVLDCGAQTEQDLREVYSLGTDRVMIADVLTKPVARDTMLCTVRRVLRLVERKRRECQTFRVES